MKKTKISFKEVLGKVVAIVSTPITALAIFIIVSLARINEKSV